jgi:hypothetical protein
VEALVRSEAVRFNCNDAVTCEVLARWHLAPTASATKLTIELERAEVKELVLDGQPLDFVVSESEPNPNAGWSSRFQLATLSADLPASGAERMLVARLRLDATFATGPLFTSMVLTRHPFVHREPDCTTVWYSGPQSHPVHRDVVLERTPRVRRRRSRVMDEVEEFPICVGRLWHGGPLVGIGAGFEPRARLRLRAGYELSSSRFTVHGLAVETDVRHQVLVVPYTDVGSPNVFIIAPSVALGVGGPLRVWPDFRAGVRVQLTLSWPIVSLIGAFDAFPRMRDEPTLYYGAFLTQFSF